MASENSDSHETNSTSLVEDTLTISFQNISYNVATSCWANINPKGIHKYLISFNLFSEHTIAYRHNLIIYIYMYIEYRNNLIPI